MRQNVKDVAIAVAVLAGTGAVLYGLWKAKQGVAAVGDAVTRAVTKDLNPASPENIVYRGVNGIGGAVTGDESWSLGSAIYDWLNPTVAPSPSLSNSRGLPKGAIN